MITIERFFDSPPSIYLVAGLGGAVAGGGFGIDYSRDTTPKTTSDSSVLDTKITTLNEKIDAEHNAIADLQPAAGPDTDGVINTLRGIIDTQQGSLLALQSQKAEVGTASNSTEHYNWQGAGVGAAVGAVAMLAGVYVVLRRLKPQSREAQQSSSPKVGGA